jgi:hypothetical protein
MHSCDAGDPAKEADRYLVFVLLSLQIFDRPQLLKHRCLLALDSSLLPAQILALFARRVHCAVRRVLTGDPLRLAAPQILGDLAI